jgi:uncharacterized protein (TIGR03066 family)
MKKFAVVAVACAALVFSGCSGPKEKIIGKWERTEKNPMTDKDVKVNIEFTKDGKVKVGGEGTDKTLDGTYKWADNDHIEITMKNPLTDKDDTKKYTVKKVDDKELVLNGKWEGDKDEDKTFTKAK